LNKRFSRIKNSPLIANWYQIAASSGSRRQVNTTDMREYGFIPSVNMKPEEFWAESTELAKMNKMDSILAYMYLMLDKAKQAHKPVHRKDKETP
jgi:hypothetical protein